MTYCAASQSSWTARGIAQLLQGRSVMVTGAGAASDQRSASGAEVPIRQPLVLIERGENALVLHRS